MRYKNILCIVYVVLFCNKNSLCFAILVLPLWETIEMLKNRKTNLEVDCDSSFGARHAIPVGVCIYFQTNAISFMLNVIFPALLFGF